MYNQYTFEIPFVKLSDYLLMDSSFCDYYKERMKKIAVGKIDIKRGKSYLEVFGKERSDEIRKKIGISCTGRVLIFTDEHKKRISAAKKGKPSAGSTFELWYENI